MERKMQNLDQMRTWCFHECRVCGGSFWERMYDDQGTYTCAGAYTDQNGLWIFNGPDWDWSYDQSELGEEELRAAGAYGPPNHRKGKG